MNAEVRQAIARGEQLIAETRRVMRLPRKQSPRTFMPVAQAERSPVRRVDAGDAEPERPGECRVCPEGDIVLHRGSYADWLKAQRDAGK